ncbi:MAG TPA: VOC family protein [Ktedonobacteraceae bacterium]|nr:VOC family protein [Ktedonobacteraceae bacterium]
MKLVSQHTVISILVKDQEEALRFYTEKLGLEKRSDHTFGPGLRLLTVAPTGQQKPEIALAKPDVSWHGEERVRELMTHIGQGAPWLFVTDDCRKEYEMLLARGVTFVSAPTHHLYGVEAVFVDLYGNTFSLLEASPEVRSMFENHSIGTAA